MGHRERTLTKVLITLHLSGFTVAQVSAIRVLMLDIWWLLRAIVGGIAVVIIVMQGIKWIGSAEDPKLRQSAKQTIIHVIIGLIIVLLSVEIVSMVT